MLNSIQLSHPEHIDLWALLYPIIIYTMKFFLHVSAYVRNRTVRPMSVDEDSTKRIQTDLRDKDSMGNTFNITLLKGQLKEDRNIFLFYEIRIKL